ncbi:hypothetical protein N0V90_011712 [Kalmusia sp. IMI 367209]|nr:hypothetical protein N0V90_011712 [Kalmusia sp. IMI 367209]
MNRVAVIPGPGKALEILKVRANHPGPGEVLVKNEAIAIQPLDAKMLHAGYGGAGAIRDYPAILGTSGAGTVQEVGESVSKLAIGDRVVFDTRALVMPETNNREGTWQESVVIGETSFDQAVLVNFPLQTAVAALHLYLGMERPGKGKSEEKVVIWGAGGAVGSYAVQYAKSVGHTVIVTASAKDYARQKRLGAYAVIDYKAADAVDELRKLGPYKYFFSASGDPASQNALASLTPNGRFASVLGGDIDLPSNVERVYKPFSQAAQLEEHRGWRDWWYGEYLPEVLRKGLVDPVNFTKVAGGLGALQQASTDVFEGKVRGKVIVNPQE